VEHVAVHSLDGERLGMIERLMLDKVSGTVAYAVIKTGGLLGSHHHYVKVWDVLLTVPCGSIITCSALARRIGQPEAVRAVAGACAANAIALGIPCHRVLRSDGTLSGYRWGVERKRALINREAMS
jgi:O-6-methylguanine DNA methyltransferase